MSVIVEIASWDEDGEVTRIYANTDPPEGERTE